MNPMQLYLIGLATVALVAVCWSFFWDKQKPPKVWEFIAKLVARALFLALFYTILASFAYMAIGLFLPPEGG